MILPPTVYLFIMSKLHLPGIYTLELDVTLGYRLAALSVTFSYSYSSKLEHAVPSRYNKPHGKGLRPQRG